METLAFDHVLAAKQGTLTKLSETEWLVSVMFRSVNVDGEAVRPFFEVTLDLSSIESLNAKVIYGDKAQSIFELSDYSFGEDMKYIQSFNFKMSFESGAEGVYQQPLMIKQG